MKNPEHEELLADVFGEADDAARREEALGLMLRLARGRRRSRVTRRIGVALVAAMLGGALAWRARAPHGSVDATQACVVVQTQRLPAAAIVHTRARAAGEVATTSDRVAVVITKLNHGKFRLVNDEELIALAGSRPAVLVRSAAGAKLIFADRDRGAGERAN